VRDRGAAVGVPEAGGWYIFLMTELLEQVVEDLRTLSCEEQDHAARLLLTLLDGQQGDFRQGTSHTMSIGGAVALMRINGATRTGTMIHVQEWMEAAMTSHVAVEALLTRVRDWWRRQDELSGVDPKELGRVAADLGMSTNALKDLAARGPDAANLLYERMHALGISRADVDSAANGLMRDLQRTCACCNEKGTCEKDLSKRPDDPVWKSYCPNAVTLDSLTKLKVQA
jgi:hypothetical protein